MGLEFFDKAREVMGKLEETQAENIHAAALLISESIQKGCSHSQPHLHVPHDDSGNRPDNNRLICQD